MKAFFVLLLFSIAFTSTAGTGQKPAVKFAAGDSLKKFPITDPRNPDCPCHQYQKLADEEYKEMLKKEKADGISAGRHPLFKQKRLKKKTFVRKNGKRKKKKISITDCFHW